MDNDQTQLIIKLRQRIAELEAVQQDHNDQLQRYAANLALEVAERNRIEATLHQAQADLDQRVFTRTADLIKSNETLQQEIVDRKRAEALVQRQAEQSKRLLAISESLLSTLPLPEALEQILQTLSELLDYEFGCFYWLDETNQILQPFQIMGGEKISKNLDDWTISVGHGIAGSVALSGQSELVNNAHLDDRAIYPPDAQIEQENLICVALKVKAKVVGIFIIGRTNGMPFNNADFELVELFMSQAAIAIYNARLYVETQRHLQEQIALRHAGQIISSTLDLDAVLHYIAEQLGNIIDTTAVYICDWNPVTHISTVLAECIGPEANQLEQVSDLGNTYAEHDLAFIEAAENGLPSSYQDDDPELWAQDRDMMQRYQVKTILYIPVQIRQKTIAFTELWESRRRRIFTPDEMALCQSILQQAAIAIENAQLYKQAQQEIIERKRVEEVRTKLEEQLHQARKMEAVGQLAGGISHDFNNLLTAIMGYAGLTLDNLPLEHPVRADIEGIQKSASRAANLTHQLLAFARKQTVKPQVVNVNRLILEMDQMFRRLIRSDIELITIPAADLGLIMIDSGQLEQILINLVVNARDAMPQGGKLTVETANITLDQHYVTEHSEVAAGDYVMLAVTDNGAGMQEEVRLRVFEPFFTTKEVGQGTGLGLATCFGIVKQNDGHIWVYSELEVGTTFKIYWPKTSKVEKSEQDVQMSLPLPRGVETILLAEDETAVRFLAARTLRQQGYTVLAAKDGQEAIKMSKAQKINLLVTDLIMPRLGGRELAKQLKTLDTELKVLFISGYTDKAIVHQGVLDPKFEFLQKPFLPGDLAHKVRQVLDVN